MLQPKYLKALIIHRHPNKAYQASLGLLDRIALVITHSVGTMWCALAFTALALVSLPNALESHSVLIMINWISQTLIQLVLLSVIMVGQNLQSRHDELRAENDYQVDKTAEEEIRKLTAMIKDLNQKIDKLVQRGET